MSIQYILNPFTGNFDAINVGSGAPQNISIPNATDWVTYPLTIGATTTPPTITTSSTNTARWRRVGDSMQITYDLSSSAGSGGSGTYLFPLPAGYLIDPSKIQIAAGSLLDNQCGSYFGYAQGTTMVFGAISPWDTSNVAVYLTYIGGPVGGTPLGSATAEIDNNLNEMGLTFTVPIQGWSANTNYTINSITVPLVAARIVSTAGDATSGASTVFIPTTVEQDTTSSYSSITGQFTCPSDGTYTVTGQINSPDQQGGNFLILFALKNGANIAKVATQNNTVAIESQCGLLITATVPCLMGDTLQVNIQNNGAQPLSTNAGENWVQFLKVG